MHTHTHTHPHPHAHLYTHCLDARISNTITAERATLVAIIIRRVTNRYQTLLNTLTYLCLFLHLKDTYVCFSALVHVVFLLTELLHIGAGRTGSYMYPVRVIVMKSLNALSFTKLFRSDCNVQSALSCPCICTYVLRIG